MQKASSILLCQANTLTTQFSPYASQSHPVEASLKTSARQCVFLYFVNYLSGLFLTSTASFTLPFAPPPWLLLLIKRLTHILFRRRCQYSVPQNLTCFDLLKQPLCSWGQEQASLFLQAVTAKEANPQTALNAKKIISPCWGKLFSLTWQGTLHMSWWSLTIYTCLHALSHPSQRYPYITGSRIRLDLALIYHMEYWVWCDRTQVVFQGHCEICHYVVCISYKSLWTRFSQEHGEQASPSSHDLDCSGTIKPVCLTQCITNTLSPEASRVNNYSKWTGCGTEVNFNKKPTQKSSAKHVRHSGFLYLHRGEKK